MEILMNNEVTLKDILDAKENRRERQIIFRNKYEGALISITVNMPGLVKDTGAIRRLVSYAVEEIRKRMKVIAEERLYPFTGPEALLSVLSEPGRVKDECILIEEAEPFGRMLDLDVFTLKGGPLSRTERGKSGRACFICGQEAVCCRRTKKHSSEEILSAAKKLLDLFKAYESRRIGQDAEDIGRLAVEAMLFEVTATPAPGLVDRFNSGAHQDMDFFTFMSSTAALSTTMARCAQAGYDHDEDPPLLLPVLRYIGLEGEKSMLEATGGINTQKGLLFSLGIASAAAGWLLGQGKNISPAAVLDAIAAITSGIVKRELAFSPKQNKSLKITAGEKLYQKYGVTGIRGEMEQGLPAVRQYGLPALKKALKDGLSINDALINTLLVLMTCVEDTTVMNRCGLEKMRVWVKEKASEAILAGGMASAGGKKLTASLDKEFIDNNVSPGGSADLLAITWFLYKVENVGVAAPKPTQVFCEKLDQKL